ncbi:WxcM-like domain-containing protein, partial [Campylobacter avium]
MQYKLLKMEINKDKRGSLIALENLKTVPFEIKRVYYIYDTKPDVDRG